MAKVISLSTADGRILAERCILADNFGSRLKGLLGAKGLGKGEALMLVPCNAIHTMGMRFAIDTVFIDKNGSVLKICPDLKPNRPGVKVSGAYAVIEMGSGAAHELNIEPGMELKWK